MRPGMAVVLAAGAFGGATDELAGGTAAGVDELAIKDELEDTATKLDPAKEEATVFGTELVADTLLGVSTFGVSGVSGGTGSDIQPCNTNTPLSIKAVVKAFLGINNFLAGRVTIASSEIRRQHH